MPHIIPKQINITSSRIHQYRILLKFTSSFTQIQPSGCSLRRHFSAQKTHKTVLSFTFSIPRMCIFAIISAVKRNVTTRSQQNVMYCRGGCFSNVLGVYRLTDSRLSNAQNLMRRRTHSWNNVIGLVGNDWWKGLHTYQHKNLHFQLVNYIMLKEEMTQGSSSAAYTVTKLKYTLWHILQTGPPVQYQHL